MPRQPARKRRQNRRGPRTGNGPITAAKLAEMIQPSVIDRALPYIFAQASDDAVKVLRAGQARRGIYFTARQQLAYTLVDTVVRQCGGDRRLAARVLGISHSSIKALSAESYRQSLRQGKGAVRRA